MTQEIQVIFWYLGVFFWSPNSDIFALTHKLLIWQKKFILQIHQDLCSWKTMKIVDLVTKHISNHSINHIPFLLRREISTMFLHEKTALIAGSSSKAVWYTYLLRHHLALTWDPNTPESWMISSWYKPKKDKILPKWSKSKWYSKYILNVGKTLLYFVKLRVNKYVETVTCSVELNCIFVVIGAFIKTHHWKLTSIFIFSYSTYCTDSSCNCLLLSWLRHANKVDVTRNILL